VPGQCTCHGCVAAAGHFEGPEGAVPAIGQDRIRRERLGVLVHRDRLSGERGLVGAQALDLDQAQIRVARRAELVTVQSPMAIVLSCSDSRVPVEIVFDCGLGDLFVVRVAGNVTAPSFVGSVEFAAAQFGTRLGVVLGHTGCGAVGATIDHLLRALISSSRGRRYQLVCTLSRVSVYAVGPMLCLVSLRSMTQ
jgi:hypothetical protein